MRLAGARGHGVAHVEALGAWLRSVPLRVKCGAVTGNPQVASIATAWGCLGLS